MKKIFRTVVLMAVAIMMSVGSAFAQETEATSSEKPKGKLDLSVDLVSSYVWRGTLLSGVSLQPGIGFNIAGFSASVWGSTDFKYGSTYDDAYSELDWTIGYSNWGASVSFTDYCWTNPDGKFDYFGKYVDNHFLELGLGFDFGYYFEKAPVYINANVMLYGANVNSDGEQAHSTYLEAGYTYSVQKIVDLSIALGAAIESKGACLYSPNDGFSVVLIDLGASHEFNIKDICGISVGADVMYNPASEGIYLGAKVGFAM